jgi:hypothetical protein
VVEGTGVELAGTIERACSRRVGTPGAERGPVLPLKESPTETEGGFDWPPREGERRLNLKALPSQSLTGLEMGQARESVQMGMLSTCEGKRHLRACRRMAESENFQSRRGLLRLTNANTGHVAQKTKPFWQHQTQSEGGAISDKTITHPCQHLRRPYPPLRRRIVLSPSERVPTGMIPKLRPRSL